MKSRILPIPSGSWPASNIHDLRATLEQHLDLAYQGDMIPPGYHHAAFNPIVEEDQLCEDGAERRHAPSDEWKFRVWAGGHMKFDEPIIYLTITTNSISTKTTNFVQVTEKITDVRVVGGSGDLASRDAKIFVTLTKSFRAEQGSDGPTTSRLQFGNSNSESEYLNDSNNKETNRNSLDVNTTTSATPLIKEQKHLCFMRHIPPSLKTAQTTPRKMRPPTNPFHSQTMTPSRTLLFRFSALSQNAHAIHLDSEFTTRVYGLPKLLVQGPLTSVLMLEVLRKALELVVHEQNSRVYEDEYEHEHHHQHQNRKVLLAVREFEYKNLLPLFVDESITIACKRVAVPPIAATGEEGKGDNDEENHRPSGRDGDHDTPNSRPDRPGDEHESQKWDVWIQKGQGENATLAVKGRAIVQAVSTRLRPV
ncbi:hypothetical protein A1O1_02167 [Capronia coronata CBS 617.96]|uniref:MaoC-like domain-containing protein n=1 Tax=Capronia coronata CBS 617.96 TaxID=1182541 RepID=W9ZGY8_9EURO|nr:uncharacterized protein A1O1_02167 [Capronia coronata CBS 617.96]EXJ93774.1 hypothetical protein A1O1_02167 [Capronia coronata CBS 617.96]